MISAIDILKTYWGYDTFRELQEKIIQKVVERKDVIALLPTGSGKSLCFQVPTLMHDKGLCIVVSPLIALMKDQVDQLLKRNIKAVALTGFLSINEMVRIMDNLQFGGVRFLYISPERLQSDFIQEKLKQLPVQLIAIDEAHCISEWGHDFRPSYLKINILREIFPHVNIIALTATATEPVVKDIEKYLLLKNPEIFKQSSVRANLKLQIIETPDKFGQLYRKLSVNPLEVSIIYAGSRKNVEQTCAFLNQKKLKSVYYHAGLTKFQKDQAFQQWFSEKFPIMVATNAFGMGIDKPNVRKVIHTNVPNSLENYIQEAGRAGRDQLPAEATIIEEPADYIDAENLYFSALPTEDFIKQVYTHLNQYFKIAYGEKTEREYPFSLNEFAHQYNLSVVKTFHSLEILEREGILVMNQQREDLVQIGIKVESETLFEYYIKKPIKEEIIKLLLRSFDGIFDHVVPVNTVEMAYKLNMKDEVLHKHLSEIQNDGMIYYHRFTQSNALKFLVPREDQYTLNPIVKDIRKYLQLKKDKYHQMLTYITNKDVCRNVQIATYFGEENPKPCGNCDVCISKQKNDTDLNDIHKYIMKLFDVFPMLNTREIIDALEFDEKNILKALRILLDDETLILNSQNKYIRNGK
ncbi:MAG: RecQ family ATP-dependent DNA helicase [Flavobacteriaceae bacterium]|nr:RecQ family ATP-dependent DNA helicase [Flavobacteriaceae bacterium]